jgi:hypothetical protein
VTESQKPNLRGIIEAWKPDLNGASAIRQADQAGHHAPALIEFMDNVFWLIDNCGDATTGDDYGRNWRELAAKVLERIE